MPLAPIPSRFQEIPSGRLLKPVLDLVRGHPLQRVLVEADPKGVGDRLATRVPYLLVPLVGTITTDITGSERVIHPAEGILHLAGCRVATRASHDCEHLRVTWDVDLTLIALGRTDIPDEGIKHPLPGRLLPGPPGPLAGMIFDQLDTGELPRTDPVRMAAIIRVLLETLVPRLQADPDATQRQPDRARAALTYIQRNCHLNMSRERVARAVGIHPNHLSRLLRKRFDRTFAQVLAAERISSVEQHLLRDTLTLNQIAENCGFSSRSMLIDTFKRVHGKTPKQWLAGQQK